MSVLNSSSAESAAVQRAAGAEMAGQDRVDPGAEGCDTDCGMLSLRVSVNMLEGGTGCSEWEAGLFLAEVLLSNPHLVQGALCVS